jgi:hypothetical protein
MAAQTAVGVVLHQSGERIKWMFSVERARSKMARAYPASIAQSTERAA